jgi:hypothetical protein|tara:strand:- start:410 stop:595 length:186 start_codon:yes stop_codon:yes gene_type:complete
MRKAGISFVPVVWCQHAEIQGLFQKNLQIWLFLKKPLKINMLSGFYRSEVDTSFENKKIKN